MSKSVGKALAWMVAGLMAAGTASAAYPDKPIPIIVPWNAGGVTDVLARSIANHMTQTTGQPVIVDNRPGANGGIGAQAAARSAADGYTVFVSNADTHAINPFIFKKLSYDPQKAFEPVSLFARVPFALILGRSQPSIKDFKGFVAAGKADPGALTFASWGTGSASHLGMELVTRSVGIQLRHVPYAGQAPGMLAVQSGHVDTMMLPAGGAEAVSQKGGVKVLGVASERRLELLPDTPTLRELGVDLVTGNWFAFHVPAGTPPEVVRKFQQMTAAAIRDPKVLEAYRVQAALLEASTPEQLGSFVATEQKRWSQIVREANVSLD
jgi:tripartite-type tricarboxylate transporter receptor subunit TctC